jgi:hypothetical protein
MKAQSYTEWPEDGKYRGVEIPKRLKQFWNTVSGRWWKQGVDDALGPIEEQPETKASPEFGVF